LNNKYRQENLDHKNVVLIIKEKRIGRWAGENKLKQATTMSIICTV